MQRIFDAAIAQQDIAEIVTVKSAVDISKVKFH